MIRFWAWNWVRMIAIVKPFETKEVTARIKAVLRRCGSKDEENKGVMTLQSAPGYDRYELKVSAKSPPAAPPLRPRIPGSGQRLRHDCGAGRCDMDPFHISQFASRETPAPSSHKRDR